jgi:hypothetical protein
MEAAVEAETKEPTFLETERAKQILGDKRISKWLGECLNANTRQIYTYRFVKFLTDTKMSVDDLLSKTPEELHDIAVPCQNNCEKANSLLTTCAAVNSFLLSQWKPTINFHGKKKLQELDTASHKFSTNDLARMFELGNTKEKAILALSCSLGWEVSGLIKLRREFIKSLVSSLYS